MPVDIYTISVKCTDWQMGRQTGLSTNFADSSEAIAGAGSGITGGSSALSDGSDATFARITSNNVAGTGTNGNFVHGLYPGIPDSAIPQPVKDAYAQVALAAPGWDIAVQQKNTVRGRSDVGSTTQSVGTEIHGARQSGPAPQTRRYIANAPTVLSTVQTRESFNFPTPAASFGVHALMRDPGVVLLRPVGQPASPAYDSLLVMDWSWVMQWTVVSPVLTEPVTRLYPRDDGKGASSAPRMVPQPRAARMVGGYQ